jgi:chemotaxis protein CheD
MLAEGPAESDNSNRYANVGHPALLDKLLNLGAKIKTLEAKIFGGSLPNCSFGNEKSHMGQLNVQATVHFLQGKGIRVVQNEVGGTRGRKLVFHTDDGRAWSEKL